MRKQNVPAKKKSLAEAAMDKAQAEQEAGLVASNAAIDAEEAAATGTAIHEGDQVAAHSNLAASQFKFKRTKVVALPLFKLEPNKERYFLVDTPMYLGKKVDDKKEAATLCNVTDLESGEQGCIIIGKVLHDLLNESYALIDARLVLVDPAASKERKAAAEKTIADGAESYVGKMFAICVRKRADKKYNTYDLSEIEPEEV